MHCIQGSDAHRLRIDPKNKKNLGIGDRATRVQLVDVSFTALQELFGSNDFARTRPHWPTADNDFDFIQHAREEGPSIIQDFHESMTIRGGRLYSVIADICAFANTNGGTLYVGVTADPKKEPTGLPKAQGAIAQLQKELSKRISPPLETQVDTMDTRGKQVMRVIVPRGEDRPYAVDDNKIYVRVEADTGLAVRDEIVTLVLGGSKPHQAHTKDAKTVEPEAAKSDEVELAPRGVQPPRTGVEIVSVEERNGERYFTMRDLRNGNMVKNVTMSSARRLWHYAITEFQKLPADLSKAPVAWQGVIGLLKEDKRGHRVRFDLAQKSEDGVRVYFGVTDDGIHSEWKRLTGGEPE
jgi:hypothetical protein